MDSGMDRGEFSGCPTLVARLWRQGGKPRIQPSRLVSGHDLQSCRTRRKNDAALAPARSGRALRDDGRSPSLQARNPVRSAP